MTSRTKHEFVDDNPYLVYSGDADTSYDGDSGSGGGGGGGSDSDILWVEIYGGIGPYNWATNPSSDIEATTNFSLTASVEEIKEAVDAGKIVKVFSKQQMSPTTVATIVFDMVSYDYISDNEVSKPVFISTAVGKVGSNMQFRTYKLDFAYGDGGYINQGRQYVSNLTPYPEFSS